MPQEKIQLLAFNTISITESHTINILEVTSAQKLNWCSHIYNVATRTNPRLGILSK